MSTKAKIISTYLAIGLLYALYAANWGDQSYKGFFYHLGGGLFWPMAMFPGFGKAVGGVIMIAVIAAVLVLK